MGTYILSSANRWYVALEQRYGEVPPISGTNRIPAVKLTAKQIWEKRERRDKTGSRTFVGLPSGLRRRAEFGLRTYLTSWSGSGEPAYGPLFRAALGGDAELFGGGTAAEGCTGMTVRFTAPHGLREGQAISYGGELRFVASVGDATTVRLNAPLSVSPPAGATIGKTVSYRPGSELPSVSIFDYWSPATAVQRIVCGAGVDSLRIKINGDYHEFEFRGIARDVLDSASFAAGQGELMEFPEEPAAADFDYAIVPGNLGQVWLGSVPEQFCTLTEAELRLENDLEARDREFGCEGVRGISAGVRSVTLDVELYELDDDKTKALYQAARQRSPIGVMIQLGESPGQLFGVYLKGLVPEPPEFDDDENRLKWRFGSCRAQGTIDDEIYVAFG